MKFIPLLLSSIMVQALPRKTQTRRTKGLENVIEIAPNPNALNWWIDQDGNAISCPYGKPGDVLWVREKFRYSQPYGSESLNYQFADLEIGNEVDESISYKINDYEKWRPSIHMPKKACRHFLKIKSIRVERLLYISEADAVAEGVSTKMFHTENFENKVMYECYTNKKFGFCVNAKVSFFSLWQSINGEKSFKQNPWVWVIEFEIIAKQDNFLN